MLRQTKTNKYRETRRLAKVNKQIKSQVTKDELPKTCPYCGGRMILKKIGDLDGTSYFKDQEILVCENFNVCGCSVKVNTCDGKKVPFGIPANRELKSLRREAHYYMEYYTKLSGMTSSEIYEWLAYKQNISRVRCHFSKMMEGQCRNMIQIFLDAILEYARVNPEKIRKKYQFQPFLYDEDYCDPRISGIWQETWSATDPKAKETIKKIQELLAKK